MLADPRADALASNFAVAVAAPAQPARLAPGSVRVSRRDRNLMASMERETELFFMSIVREDRPILDLLTADYTFVDGRLARHYNIPNVVGNRFRRVTVTDERRRGLLGQASILTVTSYPTRTSPVVRGKWVLDNLLGAPPPQPPPDVPALQGEHRRREAAAAAGASPGASREPDLRRLPRDDGSDRLRAGELRRSRGVARCSTAASRSIRQASWSTAPSSTVRSACESAPGSTPIAVPARSPRNC